MQRFFSVFKRRERESATFINSPGSVQTVHTWCQPHSTVRIMNGNGHFRGERRGSRRSLGPRAAILFRSSSLFFSFFCLSSSSSSSFFPLHPTPFGCASGCCVKIHPLEDCRFRRCVAPTCFNVSYCQQLRALIGQESASNQSRN